MREPDRRTSGASSGASSVSKRTVIYRKPQNGSADVTHCAATATRVNSDFPRRLQAVYESGGRTFDSRGVWVEQNGRQSPGSAEDEQMLDGAPYCKNLQLMTFHATVGTVTLTSVGPDEARDPVVGCAGRHQIWCRRRAYIR